MRISDWSSDVCSSDLDRLAAVSLEAARDWTFTPPSTGELAKQSSWSVRVPVDLSLGDKKEADYGEWKAYLPGPYQRADWLDDDEAGSDAVRSEERRVGNKWFSTCRTWWSADN